MRISSGHPARPPPVLHKESHAQTPPPTRRPRPFRLHQPRQPSLQRRKRHLRQRQHPAQRRNQHHPHRRARRFRLRANPIRPQQNPPRPQSARPAASARRMDGAGLRQNPPLPNRPV